jgi:hypothetical protein
MGRCLAALVAIIVSLGAAQAQRVLKEEPPPGGLGFREVVLVDDGSCPPGQINRVTGGKGRGARGIERIRRCVPRR